MGGESGYARLHASWAGFLQELTGQQPAAILVEDLH
jgi:hypothetical protein